ncbi:hypothetical protein HBI24_211160 [Parastagonospora nodorum]|nr:hypothetical protein HBH50_217660 [Parastagonospora nodorum]KAH4080180.1 hypothetical protein HBH48_212790 [Parastagonospora nodorum]KAH4156512.1 hypothetical protein HBH43_208670 [Parastagonospora nodorum]KAH4198237.1 hypothetical protein HBI95_180130 [Parastagonospora nodorum]KAH4252443.1 hypothetical protein HBI03_210480 [Parastagonospora nodorum]
MIFTHLLNTLRKELESGEWERFLALLDGFLNESGRTTSTKSMSSQRMVFNLSEGTRSKVGYWLATPLRAMSRDERFFAHATEFHAFRHVDAEILQQLGQGKQEFKSFGKPSQFTRIDDS